ncbi:MAG: response regulator, partial [Stenotrophomonas maltophilia]
LNRVLDGSRAASPAVVALVGQAYDVLPQLNAALRDGSRVTADLQAMQAIADRVAAGEETFHVPLPRAAAVAVSTPAEEVAATEAAPVVESTPANIDSVLREILEAEVEVHQATLQAWLDAATDGPQPVTDGLLRAVHTMNGAFAMTDVPEITAVTGAAECYIKRSLAADALPSAAGMAALADTCAAITTTMAALQDEAPRVPVQNALAARLVALADTLPEARWPALVEDDLDVLDDAPYAEGAEAEQDDEGDDADDADEVTAADDAAPVLATADDVAGTDVQQAELEADGLSVIAPDHSATQAEDEDALVAMELTGTNDLSAYFDAELPDAALHDAVRAGDAPQTLDAVIDEREDADLASVHAGLESVELTSAEDLSRYFDHLAEPAASVVSDTVTEAEAEASREVESATDTSPDTKTDTLREPDSAYAVSVDDAANDSWSDTGQDDDEDARALDEVLPPPPAFGEVVDVQQAVDDGLTVVDAPEASDTGVLGLDATDDNTGEADAFAEAIEATVPGASAADAAPSRFFELEDAPAASLTQGPSHDDAPAGDVVDNDNDNDNDNAAPGDALDFTQLDQELVDIFVEEGKDLLDHCDGLISELRAAPQDRDVIAGLQRDLHTLKGGARMAGINPIGDLGHGIESLLEAVAANRTDIDRSDVHLLERGFDRLHQLLTRTGQHRTVAMPDDLIAAFEQRTQGRASPEPDETVGTALPSGDAQVEAAIAALVAAPLSAPVPLETVSEDDGLPRPQQEQVRVRADLLDRLVNHAGEVAIYRSRLEQQLGAFRGAMGELDRTNARLRDQLRRLDLETEAQIVARYQREQEQVDHKFDPLELDRFSTLQQLSRALNESAADLGGLQGVLDDLSRQYDVLLQQQSRVSSELQDGLMRARMVPFDGLVPRLRRVVRQAGQDTGKQVHVILEGTHGELDRNVLDRMVAPLEHMLRNSVAHGLETPEQRRAAGKPEEGEIAIRLRREGSEIVLEVADDGAGLDREAIRRRAEQRGLIAADAVLGDAELDAMIFSPGFSTADQVSQLAGRGVGMDVVHNEVRQLGGSVDIHSVSGQGVTFTLRLPQTLAVTQAVFVQIGETTFAVPVASVSGIGRISRERFETANGGYHYGGEEFALHDLGTLIGQAQARAEGQAQVPLLLVRAGDLRVAVAIDQVLGNREIVVKPVGLQIASVPGIYGATITGDGRVVVILDVAPLVRRYLANPHKPITAAAKVSDRDVPLVMVVDDSLTMRKVTGRILERHNFEVTVARDGIEALERLEERVPDLMLLDIEMPRMDGYELASVMRADPRYQGVPIVMITSRSGDKHRQRAFELGVQRYLGKPYQELDLMRNVYDLLGIARARE